MVFIQAIKRRGILRQIAEGAKASTATLREALLAFQSQIFSPNFQKGRLLVSTSGSGQSGSFEIGVQGKEFTQDNVFAAAEEFIEILDEACAAASLDPGDAAPANTDAIFAAMVADDRLQTIRQRGSDYTLLGFPQAAPIPGNA